MNKRMSIEMNFHLDIPEFRRCSATNPNRQRRYTHTHSHKFFIKKPNERKTKTNSLKFGFARDKFSFFIS